MYRLGSNLGLVLFLSLIPSTATFAAAADERPVKATQPEPEPPKPQKAQWARIDIKGAYPEKASLPGLFGGIAESLAAGIARIDKVADDKKVSGLVLRIDNPTIGWAKLNDLRQSIGRVRAKGKKVYAVFDSASTMQYVLATACDQIVMPESGTVSVLGLRAEVSFYKNLFDKLSLQADMLRVGEYKSAAEPYTRTEMSPAFREEMEAMLDDYFDQIVSAIAESRGLEREQVIAAIDSGPLTAAAAKELGLIDHVAYADQLSDLIKAGNDSLNITYAERYGKKKVDTDFSGFTGMVKLMNMMMGVEPRSRRNLKKKIAIIHATGAIMTGRSQSGAFGGETLGSATLIKAVRKARDDAKVVAIVLRVDSPGGSALASDLMWRELELVEKPFVVSMGDVAASGGYYISMGADTIFAEPGTLTGSIGVVGGKFAMQGLFDKIGITTSVIGRGKNSGAMSGLSAFTDGERQAMQKMLDDIYGQFTTKAAKGRKMDVVKLEKLARGRVYTGRMALEIGLVDQLGTLEDAVAHARELAGVKPTETIDRLILPKATSPFESLFGPIDAEAAVGPGATGSLVKTVRDLSPELAESLQSLQIINMLANDPRLTLMPFRVKIR